MSAVERALKKLSEAQRSSGPSATPPATEGRGADGAGQHDAGSPLARATETSDRLDIDLARLNAAGAYTNQNRALADQYRTIKRQLLNHAAGAGGHDAATLVAVTSALAGEGKTFTALNLALSLTTEKDWNVLLVDADCHNPQLSRLLGVEQRAGLLDLLKDADALPNSLIVPTSLDGMSVLPLGERDAHAAELLASSRMATVCRQLEERDRRCLVIFDTSPLLLTVESTTVCGQAGQIVVVVRAGKTLQSHVMEALDRLDQSKAIGLVLNGAEQFISSGQYAGYSSYHPVPDASGIPAAE